MKPNKVLCFFVFGRLFGLDRAQNTIRKLKQRRFCAADVNRSYKALILALILTFTT